MILSSEFQDKINNRYLLLDTNFIICLFQEGDLIDKFWEFINDAESKLLIDPQIRFEFLRGTYRPDLIRTKNAFLDNFYQAPDHQSIYSTLKENALALSYVYSYKKIAEKVSFPDLVLAARCMMLNTTLIITSNRKDFPLPVFTIEGILTHEKSSGDSTNYYLLAFNKAYFDGCLSEIKQLKPPKSVKDLDLPF